MTAAEWLAQIEARADVATGEVWERYAVARRDSKAMMAAIEAVLTVADDLDTPPGPSVYTSDVAVVRREVAHQVAARIRDAITAALDPS